MSSPSPAPQVVAGRFRIISQLGEGGMGVAYRAWDNEHDVPVVVKMPKADKLSDPAFLERFSREIRAMAGLVHPHIVPIVDHGLDAAGNPFVAMRFLPGGSLADRRMRDADRKPLPINPALLHQWLPAISDALDYSHRSGVVHRDVKPDNIFFDARSNAFLGDFGVAKVIEAAGAVSKDATMTATGMAVGTYAYMSPEVFSHNPVPASDQYSLAVAVYELLAGVRPFTGTSSHIIVEHITLPAPSLKERQPQLPDHLCEAVHKALSKRPEERFATCAEFAGAVLQGIPAALPPEGVTRLLCPACHKLLKLDETVAGRKVKCPACSQRLQVSADIEAIWLRDENLAKPRDDDESAAEPPPASDAVSQSSTTDSVRTAGSADKGSGDISRRIVDAVIEGSQSLTSSVRAAILAACSLAVIVVAALSLIRPTLSRKPERTTVAHSTDPGVAQLGAPEPTPVPNVIEGTTAKLRSTNRQETIVEGLPELPDRLEIKRTPVAALFEHSLEHKGREWALSMGGKTVCRFAHENNKLTATFSDYKDVPQRALAHCLVLVERPSDYWKPLEVPLGEPLELELSMKSPEKVVDRLKPGITFELASGKKKDLEAFAYAMANADGFEEVFEFEGTGDLKPVTKDGPAGGVAVVDQKTGQGVVLKREPFEKGKPVRYKCTHYVLGPLKLPDTLWLQNLANQTANDNERKVAGNLLQSLQNIQDVAGKSGCMTPKEYEDLSRVLVQAAQFLEDKAERAGAQKDKENLLSEAASLRKAVPSKDDCELRVDQLGTTFRLTLRKDRNAKEGIVVVDSLGKPKELTNSIGIQLKLLPAGSFVMGQRDGGGDETPHQVTLTKAFYIGMHEVTNAQWKRAMGDVPGTLKADDVPVIVSWVEAVEFCRKLSAVPEEEAAGRVYRLPTEAEWEYACRAGATTRYSFGDDDSRLGEYGWFDLNSGSLRHPVGQKKPNAWGLYDMHGNVREWCNDWYGDYGPAAVTDPQGPISGSVHVIRGGGWFSAPNFCQSASRTRLDPSLRLQGFRLALSASGIKPPEKSLAK